MIENMFVVIDGIDRDFLGQIKKLDVKAHPRKKGQEEQCTKLANLREIYDELPEQYICIMHGKKLVGFINYFPVRVKFHDDLFYGKRYPGMELPITALHKYKPGYGHYLYIKNLVIHPDYADSKALEYLMDAWEYKLEDMSRYYFIKDIMTISDSLRNEEMFQDLGFTMHHELPDGKRIYHRQLKYLMDKPHKCQQCYYWQGHDKGCCLKECYYLDEQRTTKRPPEKIGNCTKCSYGKDHPCIGFCIEKSQYELKHKGVKLDF